MPTTIRLSLDTAMRRAGLSSRELARRAGCNKDTLTRYRRNPRQVDLALLARLCTALHCSLHDVLIEHPLSPTTRTGTRPPAPATPTPISPPAPQLHRTPPAAAWFVPPTVAEVSALLTRARTGTATSSDVQRLSAIALTWPRWELTAAELDALKAVWEWQKTRR